MTLPAKDNAMETQPVFVQFSDLVRHYGLDAWEFSGTSCDNDVAFVRGWGEKRVSNRGDGSVLVNFKEIAAFVNGDGEIISYATYADCDVE